MRIRILNADPDSGGKMNADPDPDLQPWFPGDFLFSENIDLHWKGGIVAKLFGSENALG